MFPGTGNMERLLGIQSYVWACWKSKMAVIRGLEAFYIALGHVNPIGKYQLLLLLLLKKLLLLTRSK